MAKINEKVASQKKATARKEEVKEAIALGEKDGLSISKNEKEGRYEITMPNYYDSYFDLVGKNKAGEVIGYEKSNNEHQKVQNVKIGIPFDAVKNQKDSIEVNRKINHSASILKEIKTEIETMEMVIAFATTGKEYVSNGIPKTAVKDEAGNVVKENGKTKFQNGGWCKGELVAVGKYFVTIKDTNPNIPQDKMVFRKLETNKMLEFAKGDYEKPRMEAVKEKLGLTDKDFGHDGSIKPGIEKFFAYDEKGRATKISDTYIKKNTQSVQQTNKNEKQDEAALAR